MENQIKFGKISISPVDYGSQGNAILGIRDSGKTYTATYFAEQLFESGIPFVAFDPIGVWRYLRVPGAGAGYKVVVAGGQEGDLPLTVASATEIVRAAMQNGVSLVIDLFDINLSKADWKKIVTACVRVLLHENKQYGMRHIFLEEAAEFAPQRVGPDQGVVYAEIEKLARMGGNSRLGYTLINQRSEEVNKAVLELCDNLFLHRQKGRNSLQALGKWLDVGAVKNGKEVVDSLATLPTGQCWGWLAGSETPVLVKVPQKTSLHPDRRVMRGEESAAASKPVSVDAFVVKMRAAIAALPPPASDKKKPDNHISRVEIEQSYQRGFSDGQRQMRQQLADKAKEFAQQIGATPIDNADVRDRSANSAPWITKVKTVQQRPTLQIDGDKPRSMPLAKGPAGRILNSLAFWSSLDTSQPSREQVAAIALRAVLTPAKYVKDAPIVLAR